MSANDISEQFAKEKARFEFGKNWAAFSTRLDRAAIDIARQSIQDMLETPNLAGLRVLDIGSGSGLFSLAACELGATVVSFDYDPASVETTKFLRDHFRSSDPDWRVEQGSVLDRAYVDSLGKFDIVYSWGVLHHTGEMWRAIENAIAAVKPGGRLFIAIYNDQGAPSIRWLRVKRLYNALPKPLRWLVLIPAAIRLRAPMLLRGLLKGHPFKPFRDYRKNRGMSAWYDVVDWVGGLPFEVATPEAIFHYLRDRGFRLDRLKTCGGGRGCNEFVATLDR